MVRAKIGLGAIKHPRARVEDQVRMMDMKAMIVMSGLTSSRAESSPFIHSRSSAASVRPRRDWWSHCVVIACPEKKPVVHKICGAKWILHDLCGGIESELARSARIE
jgi:hypothetical protein